MIGDTKTKIQGYGDIGSKDAGIGDTKTKVQGLGIHRPRCRDREYSNRGYRDRCRDREYRNRGYRDKN